ncbi:hypothetical protein P3T27_005531 [Kitasatospora sp. MAA19]|nr:hypothetical protein [Kitasatospora sp. MAA19]
MITAGVRCGPAHIHQVGAGSTLTELHALVPLVHLLVLLAGPAPSGSSGASRRCQDCFPPLPATPGSGCPQLRGLAATRPRRRSFTSARSSGASWRTNRSSNRRSRSPLAQQCSLVCISSTRRSALNKAISSASVFTNDLPALQSPPRRLAGPLRHVRSFPPLGLLRGLRPTCGPQPATGLSPAVRTGCPAPRTTAGGSHVHHVPIGQVGVPLLPRQHRHAYAADLQRGLPTGSWRPASELTTPAEQVATHCTPAHILQVGAGDKTYGALHGFLFVRLLASLAGPGTSGSAAPSRRCQGCFPSSPAFPGSDCPQLLPSRCDGPAVKVSHLHSVTWRLVAHPAVLAADRAERAADVVAHPPAWLHTAEAVADAEEEVFEFVVPGLGCRLVDHDERPPRRCHYQRRLQPIEGRSHEDRP